MRLLIWSISSDSNGDLLRYQSEGPHNSLLTTVSHVAPKLLIMNIRGMPPVERIIFLLSGFQCPYVVEWE